MTLATIFGGAGAILVLVGLVGGGFTFTGAEMPKVGRVARVLCFTVGGLLLSTSIVLFAIEQPIGSSASAAEPAVSESAITNVADSRTELAIGYIIVPEGYTANVMELPYSGAAVVTSLPAGAMVQIVCTVQGDSVTSPLTGFTSSLWNGTMDGGFIPDVYVDTGTTQPTMPNCMD